MRLAKTLGLIGLVAAILCGIGIWGGGYWENMPLLDRISGPLRFEQFVIKPAPAGIRGLRGGYSGFPQGIITTHFRFDGDLTDANRYPFMLQWERVEQLEPNAAFFPYLRWLMPEAQRVEWADISIAAARSGVVVFRKKYFDDYMYLLAAPNRGEGLLYIP